MIPLSSEVNKFYTLHATLTSFAKLLSAQVSSCQPRLFQVCTRACVCVPTCQLLCCSRTFLTTALTHSLTRSLALSGVSITSDHLSTVSGRCCCDRLPPPSASPSSSTPLPVIFYTPLPGVHHHPVPHQPRRLHPHHLLTKASSVVTSSAVLPRIRFAVG